MPKSQQSIVGGWSEGGGAEVDWLALAVVATWAARRVRCFWLATIILCSLLIKTKLSAHTHTQTHTEIVSERGKRRES